MLKIILCGCDGRMGSVIQKICSKCPEEYKIVAGFSKSVSTEFAFPVFSDFSKCEEAADVVIDFSNSEALSPLLEFCVSRKLPIVLCTTGFSDSQIAEIKRASTQIPVFRSGNMSLGINLMTKLIKTAATVLGKNFDVEIIEKHHNKKVDAPSGTALMLADAMSDDLPYEPEYIYDRHSERHPREKNEIGIHSVRGGTIVGEHEVIFAGENEIIQIKHSALSREVFANGAIEAAKFISAVKKSGMYDMSDLISQKIS